MSVIGSSLRGCGVSVIGAFLPTYVLLICCLRCLFSFLGVPCLSPCVVCFESQFGTLRPWTQFCCSPSHRFLVGCPTLITRLHPSLMGVYTCIRAFIRLWICAINTLPHAFPMYLDNTDLEGFASYLGLTGIDTDTFYEAYYQLSCDDLYWEETYEVEAR